MKVCHSRMFKQSVTKNERAPSSNRHPRCTADTFVDHDFDDRPQSRSQNSLSLNAPQKLHDTKTQSLIQLTAPHFNYASVSQNTTPAMAAKLRFYSQKYTEAYHSASNTSVMTLCSLANIKITGSQNQQLLDPVHIINQTSSITFSGSHDNRTSVSRHPIILC